MSGYSNSSYSIQGQKNRHSDEIEVVLAKTLTTKARKKLPSSAFVFPKTRRYPIHDKAHAINALARSKGKPEESKVRAAVCKKYPGLPACKSKKGKK